MSYLRGVDMVARECTIDGCAATHRARGYCSSHYNALVLGEGRRHPRETRSCVICAARVTRRCDARTRPTCSVRCRRILQFGEQLAPTSSYAWRHDAVKRAHKAGALIVHAFDRETVFARDGWQCRGCSARCNDPDPFDIRAATVDHVIPLSAGGDHTLANVQTLCLSCNSAKQSVYSTRRIGVGATPSNTRS